MSLNSAFSFLPNGALIQDFKVAGHSIVLGFPDAEPYATAPFFGETIGRVANRTKNGVIDNLNGKSYQLQKNNGPNHLHGGASGWGKKKFSGPHPLTRNGKESVQFTYVSPDGDEGYPGTVELRVFYSASEESEDGVTKTVLTTEYEVEMTGDEVDETAVNVTNHSYFTVSNAATIEGTEVTLGTTYYQEVDEHDIPTGTVGQWPGVETNKAFVLGAKEPDIDHCFLMDPAHPECPLDTRALEPKKLVGLFHPSTKLHLEVFSTEPAFQFYTGKYIDVAATDNTPARGARAGICIEPSRYINAINVPEWRDQVLLKKGNVYGAKSVYKAWKS